jgi:RNase P protein component
MIAKSSKFPTRSQFLTFRAKASQITTPHLRLLSLPHTPSRLSVIVPIKVNKRAVVRNSFRRLAYDALWKTISPKNLDCVLLFKPLALIKGRPTEELILAELKELHV